jgi:hypothetical protein
MKLDLHLLVDEINHREAEIEEKGLTRMEYALLLSIQPVIKDPEEQLIKFIKDLNKKLEPQLFPNWHLKQDTIKQVQVTIFEALYEQYKDKVEDVKQLIELRDELIKWIERHGTR